MGHAAGLCHVESQTWHTAEEDLVVVAGRAIDIPGRWRVVVVQADDSQDGRRLPCQILLRLFQQVLRIVLLLRHILFLLLVAMLFLFCGMVVLQEGLVFFSEVLAELVLLLGLVPVFLPVTDAKALIVLEGVDVEVRASDGIEHREASGGPQGICIGRQLRALEEDGPDGLLCLQDIHRHLDDTRLDDVKRHLLSFRHGIKTWNGLAALDDEAVLIHIKSTAVEENFLLRSQ
mmetsp:Transcript_64149/g.155094  ORF Transcript_64149/g.155094 Transcript_64149/m.155094 type:complete len:232 (+) Transcript_64149:804-1499(+)